MSKVYLAVYAEPYEPCGWPEKIYQNLVDAQKDIDDSIAKLEARYLADETDPERIADIKSHIESERSFYSIIEFELC